MRKNDSSKSKADIGTYEKALQRAAGLCSRQEQCTSHIREKLRSWNVTEEDEGKIILKLTEEKFLDDARYAGFYVKDKFKLNRWGRIRITHMLRQKRIEEEFIGNALLQIDEEEWFQTCLELVQSKFSKLKEEDPFKRKGKLLRFAASRGFEPALIYRALEELESK
jgi:regulatory protein